MTDFADAFKSTAPAPAEQALGDFGSAFGATAPVQKLNKSEPAPTPKVAPDATHWYTGLGGRVADAFMGPFQRPDISKTDPYHLVTLAPELHGLDIPAKVGSSIIFHAVDAIARVGQGVIGAATQLAAEPLAAVSGENPTDTAAALSEYIAAATPMGIEFGGIGVRPRVPRQAARAVAEVPPNPLGTIYTVEDVQTGRLAADVEKDAWGQHYLSYLAPDKSNIDGITENYQLQLERLDPTGEHWPNQQGKMVSDFRAKAMAAAPREVYPSATPPSSVGEAMKASDKVIEETENHTLAKVGNMVRRQVWDRAGTVRSALLKKAGPEGVDAEQKFTLSAGAPGAASHEFQGHFTEIYGGAIIDRMPKEEKAFLDDVVHDRRVSQALRENPDFTSPYGKTPAEFTAHLEEVRGRVGDPKFLELNARAEQWFTVMRAQVDKLRTAGLIDDEAYDKLRSFSLTPREHLDLIDPFKKSPFGGAIKSSGLPALAKGDAKEAALNRNSDTFLAEMIARTTGRIARNDATKSLSKVAEHEGNGIVSFNKDDKALGPDPVKISYIGPTENVPTYAAQAAKAESILKKSQTTTPANLSYTTPPELAAIPNFRGVGEQELWMNREMAKEWLNYAPESQGTIARTIARYSGINLLRTVATGINPAAGPFLFLMDATDTVFTSHMYSTFVPKGMIELGHDILTVLPDVVTRGPRYQKYIEEGGGMPFLVHGAHGGQGIHDTPFANKGWNAVKTGLGYWNESFELAMRLGIRERGLRQGLSPEKATYEARRWIDFSQGGHTIKFIDNYIMPYTNAGVQGLRQLGYNAAKNPKKFALRMGQFSAGVTALWLWNNMRHPHVMQQIPQEQQAKNFHFATDMHANDVNGEKQWMGFALPVPPPLRWIKGTIEAALNQAFYGKLPTRELMQSYEDSFGVFGSPTQMISPVIKAAVEYNTNYSLYAGHKIWSGSDQIPPSEEYKQLPDTPSSQLAIDLGRATGLSPDRMTQAFHDVVPRSLFSDAADWAYKWARTGDPLPEDAQYATGPNANLYVARQFPFLSRLIFVTHPLSNLYEEVQQTAQAGQGAAFDMGRQMDTLSMKYGMAQGVEKKKAFGEVQAFLKGVPDYARQRLESRFKETVLVDAAYARFSKELDVPPKKFWTIVAQMPAETRAQVYYEQWHSRDSSGKRAMQALARSMPGFYSQPFGVMFNRIRKERGTSPEE